MITDVVALTDIRRDWEGLGQLQQKIKRHMFVAGGALFLADCAHNLPFLQACSVLNDVLEQLRDEGHFPGKGLQTLGALVGAARDGLPWVDYSAVERIVSVRNDLAHRAHVLTRKDCWSHIATIEAELKNWSVIP